MDKIEGMENGEVLELTTNFRSSGGLLDFINENFEKILKRTDDRKSVSVDYTKMNKCEEKADGKFKTSNWQLNPTSASEGKKGKVDVTRPREGFMVASKIQEMIKNEGLDAGDFLVLFKASTDMKHYENALRQLDIPVLNTKSKDFLKKSEIIELLNLLALSAFPKEKYYKHCVNESDLIFIDEKSLDEVLEQDASYEVKFRQLCNLAGFVSIAVESNEDVYLQFIENICSLAKTELVANNYDLKRTFNNLFEKAVNDSFFSDSKVNDESVHLQTKKANAVTLMTIHASKGLESKVVIMASQNAGKMADKKYVDRAKDEILVQTTFLTPKLAEALDLDGVSALYEKADAKREEEDKRVLYVGVTRAEEQFILLTNSDGTNGAFINILLDKSPTFSDTVELNFEDYEAAYDKVDKFITVDFKESLAAYNPSALEELNSTDDISVSVTTLIKDQELFTNIEGRKNGMAFGTFSHQVMEYICNMIFDQKNIEIDTNLLIKKLYADFPISLESEYIVELEQVAAGFLKSDLAQDIINCTAIHTEIPFASSEKYHGIIDLIVETDDKVRIIDFKSDLLKSKKEEIKAHYKKQVELYVTALSGDSDKEVVGECLYLFG